MLWGAPHSQSIPQWFLQISGTNLLHRIKYYKCTWYKCHLRTKLTFSLHSVANISGNMLAIIHNVSHWVPLGVTRYMVIFFLSLSPSSFDYPLSVFSSRCVLKWQCVLYMRMMSHSHMASNVFSEFFVFFSLLTWCEAFWVGFYFRWVLTRLCQRVSVFFRWSFKSVHVTLHPVWQTQEDSWTVKYTPADSGTKDSPADGFGSVDVISSALLFLFPLSTAWNCSFTVKTVNHWKVFVRWTTLLDFFFHVQCMLSHSGIFKHAGQVEHRWILFFVLFCSHPKLYHLGGNERGCHKFLKVTRLLLMLKWGQMIMYLFIQLFWTLSSRLVYSQA